MVSGIVAAIVGATATGKTSLACDVLAGSGLHILSADSRQVYRGFSIGTGRPDEAELKCVAHEMVGKVSPEAPYSAGEYLRDVGMLLKKFPTRRYILVGGTGFYLRAVLEGLPDLPSPDMALRSSIGEELARDGLQALMKKLQILDPLAKIDTKNPRRVLRALEVCLQTGRPFSSFLDEKKGGLGPFPVFHLALLPQELHAKIRARVRLMFEKGWEEEVRSLLAKDPHMKSPAFNSLGYREVAAVIAGNLSRRNAEEKIIVATRRYAKRQRSFFRNQLGVDGMTSGKISLAIRSLI